MSKATGYEGLVLAIRCLVPTVHVQVTEELALFQWFDEWLKKHARRTFVYTGQVALYSDSAAGTSECPKGWMHLGAYLKFLGSKGEAIRLSWGERVDFDAAVRSAMAYDPKDEEGFFLVPEGGIDLTDGRNAAWVRRLVDSRVLDPRFVRTMIFVSTCPAPNFAPPLAGHIKVVDERVCQEEAVVEYLKEMVTVLRSQAIDVERFIPLVKGMSRAQIADVCTESVIVTKKQGFRREFLPELFAAYRTKVGLPPVP
jgi:hypothetical protein